MISTVAFALTILYVSLLSIFLIGTRRLRYNRRTDYEPTVSIIVAARNEEEQIHRSLNSLSQLEYPADKLEIIFVDDQSSDRTYEIIKPIKDRHPQFRLLKVTTRVEHLKGKANAIAIGIDHSHGELIFLTDADCIVPKSWVRSVVEQYKNDIGLVAAYTLLECDGPFGGMQSLDWAFLHTIAAGAVGLGRPLSCFGNNLSFRREAYDEVGGYRKTPFSVTEDFALFTAITKKTRWKYNYLIMPDTLVFSLPCRSWRELLRQKRRWVIGGLDLKLRGFVMLGLGLALNLLLVFGPILGFTASSVFLLWLPKILVDALFLAVPLRRNGRIVLLKHFLVFELYYTMYVLAIPFIMLSGQKVVWRGREF